MSAGFGHNKGKDGKYNTLNLTTYKGRSVDSSKHSGSGVRHGLQSLGKVAATRRVPPPASLPSLKSENLGNDPNVNLVPKDGSGWASKSEATNQTPTTQQPTQSQSQPPSQQRQASVSYLQASTIPTSNQLSLSNQNQSSSQSNGLAQSTWGAPRYSQAGSKPSGPAGGTPTHGTTHFSEEFPTLGEEKEQQHSQSTKSKEQQYGPGPNLRPQNVASWRGGGGQNLTPKENYVSTDDSKEAYADGQLQAGSGGSFDTHHVPDGRPASHPNVSQSIPPQQYHAQYRPNMMPPPQYMGPMYNNRFPHPGMPPSGMRYQSAMMPGVRYPPVYPNDPRFRAMVNQPMPSQPLDSSNMPPIIPQSEFKEFDKLDKEDDGGWAGMHGEVDYGEKLVFSDDEDGGKQNSRSESSKTKASASKESKTEIKPKESSAPSAPQAWVNPQYDQHMMAHWSQQYYMYRTPMPGQPPVDFRSKTPAPYDKHMPPQGHPYPPGQMAPPHVYPGHPPAMGATHFGPPVGDPASDRLTPHGDEDTLKKSDKEEAMERARKRREEEEKRMEQQRRSSTDNASYYSSEYKRTPSYPHRFPTPEDEMHAWQQDMAASYDDRQMYNRRTESESSDDRRAMRDRMPGDGYGGSNYRHQPRPSAGGVASGRNLPPRLANQRQKQDSWQTRVTSPSYQTISFDASWMGSQQHGKPAEHRVGPSIMKRERSESEGMESHDSRVRNISESSSPSLVTPVGEAPPEDKKSYPLSRDLYRRDDKKLDDKRNVENASPASSDREPKLWDGGTSSKRSSIKRQSSRDSPASAGSGDARLGSQKTLLSRSDSNRNKPITKWGSNQSNQSVEKEETKQPATVRPRRINDKVKWIDFRVDSGDEDDITKSRKLSASKAPYKSGRSIDSKSSYQKEDEESRKYENKITKPIATVSPTATTTSTARDSSQKNFAVTRITRDMDPVVEANQQQISDDRREESQYGDVLDNENATRGQEPPRTSWDEDEPGETSTSTTSKEPVGRDYNRPSKSRPDHRGNRGLYSDQAERGASHRYSAKDSRSYRISRDGRDDFTNYRDDNRGVRRYRTGDNRYQQSASERGQRTNSDRFDNRNRRDGRDGKGDVRKDSDQTSKGKPSTSSQQGPKQATSKVQTTKATSEKGSVFTSKPTAAAAPITNIWEERKKQQQVQSEVEKHIYRPTEDDRKRTLKETAPNPRAYEDTKVSKDDKTAINSRKSRDDTNVQGKSQDGESRRRQNALPEKRLYEAKPYQGNGGRRGSASQPQHRGDRKPLRSHPSDANERDSRIGARGRGRSRGSNYRGNGRARGQASYLERSSARNSAPPRGRGSRSNRASHQYVSSSSKPAYGRGRFNERKYVDDEDDEYDSVGEDSYESDDDEAVAAGRRRRVGEGSDAEDDFSTDGSYSDGELYDQKAKRDTTGDSYFKRGSRPMNSYRSSRPGRGRSNNGSSTFLARGEPSRRGRGRGNTLPRGRGRGVSRTTTSAPPADRSYRSEEYIEPNRPKNLERGPRDGADKRPHSDRRKRRSKPDRPPRFKNSSRPQHPYSRDSKPSNDGASYPRQDATSPVGDSGTIHSSDLENDEWETASDNSREFRKAPLNPVEEIKRNEPKRSFSNQRPAAGRGRGGRGVAVSSDRAHGKKQVVGKMDNQVYTLHTIDYNNPSAIEGAIRDASNTEAKAKKQQEEAQKTKHEDLFRLYDLNNYAGVVSVDDLPDSSLERKLDSAVGMAEDITTFLDSSLDFNEDAGDGFTQVVSRKSLRKKQEEIRKKDKEQEQMNEVMRRNKVEQQRQNRQKFFNKSSSSAIAGGSSGSIKQPVPTTGNENNIWPTLDTWTPAPVLTETKEVGNKDASISQHDSGVESSVPSSQRGSPGTETKLSFSHFGVANTSTSVITSIGNHPIPSSVVASQSSVSISNLISSQQTEVVQNSEPNELSNSGMQLPKHEFSEVSASSIALDFSETASRSSILAKQDIRSLSPSPHSSLHRTKAGLRKASSNTSSPSRNPIVPIGNERLKNFKQSDSIENISSLFSSLDDTNRISFIADASEEKNSMLSVDQAQNTAFTSYSSDHTTLSVSDMRANIGTTQGFTGYAQEDFTIEQSTSDITLTTLPAASFPMPLSSGSSISTTVTTTMATTIERHVLGQPSYMHQSTTVMTQPSMQGSFLDGSSSDIPSSSAKQSIGARANAGVKSDSEVPSEMTLPPQAPSNDNVGHNGGRSLEGTSVPGPIPMPPKHSVGSAQRPDGDGQLESRQLRDVNASANGAGDMGLLTPTSPSAEFNKKMESARKAWEKSAEPPSASQQAHGEPSDSYVYHPSTAATGSDYQPVETSNLQSGTLSVTNSTEWKPRQTAETTTAKSDVDEAWRSKLAQPTQNTIAATQVTPSQTFTSNPVVTSSDEMTSNVMSSGFSTDTSTSTSVAQSIQQQKQITPTYSSSGGTMYVDQTYNQSQHRLGTQQASHSNLYSSSLATNLHNMQQAYASLPPDYTQSLYSAPNPGYNTQHPTYNPAQRDFNQPVIFASTTAMTSAVKTPTQNTIALKPIQRDVPAAYVATSVQGMEQQSAHLGLPRPQAGTSPAQPITYIPLMDQNRIPASQAAPAAIVNHTIAAPQRPHSSSYYSQLNQPGSNYYAPQAASQLRQQPFQQAIVAPQSVTYSQGLGLDSSSIWGLQQNPGSYTPIGAPAQRIRSDGGDYQTPGIQAYYQKNVVPASKFVPSSTPGVYPAAPSSNVLTSNFSAVKPNQMFSPKDVTSSGQDMTKFSMSSSTTSQIKLFNSQSMTGDWNKSSAMSNLQYKNNSIQGILSRPFSSSTDTSYHQSPTLSAQTIMPKQDMNMPPRMRFSQPGVPQTFAPQQPGWGQKPPQGGQGIMGAQPPTGLMTKVPPRPPMSVMGQRFTVPQSFQQTALTSQVPAVTRNTAPYSLKPRPTAPPARMAAPPTSQHFVPPESTAIVGKSNKPSQSSSQSHGKMPPVPTLVRGSGSNLAGKKPTFMPEEVVKSNQANERANLLQSLSSFFPDKPKSEDKDSHSQDWSTQVANSSPLPKRKPGMRHPGIEKRKPNTKERSGPIGSTKNLKRLQKPKKEEPPSDTGDSVARSVKKMTLADTKPKKGEVAKIQLN